MGVLVRLMVWQSSLDVQGISSVVSAQQPPTLVDLTKVVI
jgi:hypothetical protein